MQELFGQCARGTGKDARQTARTFTLLPWLVQAGCDYGFFSSLAETEIVLSCKLGTGTDATAAEDALVRVLDDHRMGVIDRQGFLVDRIGHLFDAEIADQRLEFACSAGDPRFSAEQAIVLVGRKEELQVRPAQVGMAQIAIGRALAADLPHQPPFGRHLGAGVQDRPGQLGAFQVRVPEVGLLEVGFLDPENPRHLMRRLRRLYNRAGPDSNEMNILRGILSATQQKCGGR